jgi:poly-gamma-glutamate capsule biosynthesis protein CapA/YwtB (metallophosphatase superfamily)
VIPARPLHRPRRTAAVVVAVLGALATASAAGCSRGVTAQVAAPAAAGASATLHLALAGDTGAEGASARVLTDGMGSVGAVLERADVAFLNLETVLADSRAGLAPQPKTYTFLAPTRLLDVLHRSGVDAVTLANNHGLDFGRAGLTRTLAARGPARPGVVGAGAGQEEALAPWRTVVKGRGVTFFGATDVLDEGLDWAATAGTSGLATTKTDSGYSRLREAVRRARKDHPGDVVVVYLHAGVERQVCPTSRQQQLARDLAGDGASVVAMSHAHVLQPFTTIGSTAVAYGLGNFVFAARSPGTSTTGVLDLEVPPTGAPRATWRPARIRDGVPALMTGAAGAAAVKAWAALDDGC